MKVSWVKLEDGDWGAKCVGAPYSPSLMLGTTLRIYDRTGQVTEMIPVEHIKQFRIKGGQLVDIYRVRKPGEACGCGGEYCADCNPVSDNAIVVA